MPVVSFEEIVAADIKGFPTSGAVRWEDGGGVELDEIVSIGTVTPSDRFDGARFNIRFKSADLQSVGSPNTTAVRKLNAGLTQIWVNYRNADLTIQPIDLIGKE